MLRKNYKTQWEEFYKNNPLSRIPWNAAPADFLRNIIKEKKIESPGTVIDIGCGTGLNSILLAQNGFDVLGIDISKTAIKYAKQNAKDKNEKCKFIVGDATKLSKLVNIKFDIILDWATFHGIDENLRDKYIKELEEVSKPNTILILRVFSTKTPNIDKEKQEGGSIIAGRVTKYFSLKDIKKYFGRYFDIVEMGERKFIPPVGGEKHFWEIIMKRSNDA